MMEQVLASLGYTIIVAAGLTVRYRRDLRATRRTRRITARVASWNVTHEHTVVCGRSQHRAGTC